MPTNGGLIKRKIYCILKNSTNIVILNNLAESIKFHGKVHHVQQNKKEAKHVTTNLIKNGMRELTSGHRLTTSKA